MGVGDAVRRAGVDLEDGAGHQRRRDPRGPPDRDDLVVVAVQHEGRHVELRQVLREIGLREGLDAVVGVLVAGHHALHPERVDHALRRRRAGAVVTEEGPARQVDVELRAIGERAGAQTVEDVDRHAVGIGRRLHHQRRHRGDQAGRLHASGTVPTDVAGHFPAAGREPEQGGARQVERVEQGRQVVGIRVHLVAVPGLARSAVPTAVVAMQR